jgi:hypothetical protein
MDPVIWGPHYWYVLHSIAKTYPVYPTEVSRKKYYEFILNIPIFLPDEEIGNRFSLLLDKYPVSSYLNTRKSLMKWMHFIHNKINTSLGKEHIGYKESLTLQNEYNNKKKFVPLTQQYRITIYRLVTIIILLCITFYFYHKI